MMGARDFHVLLSVYDLRKPIMDILQPFPDSLGNGGKFNQYGGAELFDLVAISKCLPVEWEGHGLDALGDRARVGFDDRAPDEDAHTAWGMNPATGAVINVRPAKLLRTGLRVYTLPSIGTFEGGRVALD